MKRALWLPALALLASACGGEPSTEGAAEPVRATNGQFQEGELPGLTPLTPEEIAEGAQPVSPNVTTVDGAGGVVRFGDPSRNLRGRTTADAVAVAFRFAELGTGYWVAPVRTFDAIIVDEFAWDFRIEFSRALPPGLHRLLFAAIGEDGEAGTQLDSTLCVDTEIPSNRNACAPRQRPPSLVVSLGWDVDADLDLQVLTPTGKLVEAKEPVTAPGEAGAGVLDLDANRGCSSDGRRRENLVFNEAPPSGSYYIYANLFDACGEAAARFDVTIHTPEAGPEPNTWRQVEVYRRGGALLSQQANGGSKIGLFVTEFRVP